MYGPLRDFPIEPDLVLIWLTPRQARLYSEAVGSARWTSTSPTAVFGRAACAALPVAFEASQFGKIGITQFEHMNSPEEKLEYFKKVPKVTATRRTIFKDSGDLLVQVISFVKQA